MKKFFVFEVKHWVKQPMTWIFLLVYAIFVLLTMVTDSISVGGGTGNTHRNAPMAIENLFGWFSLIGIIMNTAFFNATATRDYTYGMDQIVFASPIKKPDYFFGKFFGAFVVALIPYAGITLAAFLAPYWPGVDPLRFGAFVPQAHVYGFLLFGVFNTLFGGALIYSFALYFRNPVISYLASFGILALYSITAAFTGDIENQNVAMLLDPLGSQAMDLYTKYWTPAQKNHSYVGFEGQIVLNRAVWAAFSMLVLYLMYRLFDFTKAKSASSKKAKAEKAYRVFETVPVAIADGNAAAAWLRQFFFELRSIVKNNSFIILNSIGLIILIVNLAFNTGNYGDKSLPVTYSIVGTINAAKLIFINAFIIFYTGYSVFRERDVKFNEITDATPVRSGIVVTTKVAAIIGSLVIVFTGYAVAGMIDQLLRGYTNLEPSVYLKLLGINLFRFSFVVVISYLLQMLINNKYLAYFVVLVFLIANFFIWSALKMESNMLAFGNLPNIIYSDMNGLGPFIPGTLGFGLYWTLASCLLLLVAVGMQLRGKELDFKRRLYNLGQLLGRHVLLTSVLLIAFIVCGGWLYYNTKVENHYYSSKERELQRVSYEQKYKKYQHMDLPFATDLDYHIDLFPEDRDMQATIKWWVKNVHARPITEMHYNMPRHTTQDLFVIPNATLASEDKELHYRIYKLSKPLMPGDSIQLSYSAIIENNGIENEVSFEELTKDGTFFHDGDLLPAVGYNEDYELSDKNERRKYKLPEKGRMAKLTRNCGEVCNTSYINNSATWVKIRTTISTAPDELAIAPGTLVKQWKAEAVNRSNGSKNMGLRNFYSYELKHTALNFFAFVSAQYEVKRDTVNGVTVEIYYNKKHPYNIARMTDAVKKSLKYYTEHFGPYYQEQCRIIEYPRYQSYAQAFPGTMPYSESIGFITDLRDPKAIDMVTYVVAHEMGHQWWAHQVTGPAMQGSEMFSEGLAQYSSLMVMEKAFGKQKINRFLKYELDNYLRGRTSEGDYENPLMRTEGQQYIHYNKASLVFYYLKEMIGEDKFNGVLRNLVNKYAYKPAPFPTAFNVVDEFRAATPDSMKYLITDLFETITLFNNRVEKVTVTPTADKNYNVQLSVICEKLRGDSLGNEKPIALNDYIDIGLFAKNETDGDELGKPILYNRIRLTQRQTTLNFTVAQKPYQAGVDPYHYLIDKVISDNLKKVD